MGTRFLPYTAAPIKDAPEHWIDIDGSVYAIEHRNNHPRILYKKALDEVYGYKYCSIDYILNGKKVRKRKRVHRLVAEAFIPNPENKPVVCHRNNIKSDNRKDNLYWGTVSENTQQAFDDLLIVNAKGKDDTQSISVKMYDTNTNKFLNEFGSIREASRITGIDATTISRQCKYHRPVRKKVYFRFSDDKDCN